MGAGTGVLHSEFNPSNSEPAHFLQIWIQPRQKSLPPRYTEWQPKPETDGSSKVLLISPDGRDDSATIAQDADVYRLRLKSGETVTHTLKADRGAWLQVMRGSLTLNGKSLSAGDAAAVEDEPNMNITASATAEALLFDLA